MNITNSTIYVHNGIPLVHAQINSKISGFLPAIHTKLAEEPKLSVKVGKITLTQWRSVVSFFNEINKKEKSEAQVRLFLFRRKTGLENLGISTEIQHWHDNFRAP